MKFYDFSDYEYYALIGAKSQEEATKFYEETVSDIEPDDEPPAEITEKEAREKLLDVCEKSVPRSPNASASGMKSVIQEAKDEALAEFEQGIKGPEPYLILIDGTLI